MLEHDDNFDLEIFELEAALYERDPIAFLEYSEKAERDLEAWSAKLERAEKQAGLREDIE